MIHSGLPYTSFSAWNWRPSRIHLLDIQTGWEKNSLLYSILWVLFNICT